MHLTFGPTILLLGMKLEETFPPTQKYVYPGLFTAALFVLIITKCWKQLKCPYAAAAAAESLPSCPTLRDPIDGSPPGSPSLGFSRQEHWSGLPFPSRMHACMLSRFSRVQLWVTLWTAAHQAPLSTGFSRQEYWSGLPFPSPFKGLK